jgi:hypothetical protein
VICSLCVLERVIGMRKNDIEAWSNGLTKSTSSSKNQQVLMTLKIEIVWRSVVKMLAKDQTSQSSQWPVVQSEHIPYQSDSNHPEVF